MRTACNQGSKPRDSAATLGTRFISCVFRFEGFSKKIFAGASMRGGVGLRGNFLICTAHTSWLLGPEPPAN